MWLQLPSLLLLNLRVRANLRRLGFAGALAAYAPPDSRRCKTVGSEALAFAQSSALWLRRFANLSQRLPSVGAWLNRLFGPSACLDQSITLRTFLQARGFPAELKIGSKHPAGQSFSAHAWIELSGVAIGERPDVAQAHAVFQAPL
jgi:hypothetical protein